MRLRIIKGVSYQILCDKLPFPFTLGRGGEEAPIIVLRGDVICLLRDMDFHDPYIITLHELINNVSEISEITWRNPEYKKDYIKFYTNLINLMTAYQREITIDSVLRKEIDYRYCFC